MDVPSNTINANGHHIPLYLPHLTFIVGKVLLSQVLWVPGILPADRPSHSYLNRRPLEAGCSTISTYMSLEWLIEVRLRMGLLLTGAANLSSKISRSFIICTELMG